MNTDGVIITVWLACAAVTLLDTAIFFRGTRPVSWWLTAVMVAVGLGPIGVLIAAASHIKEILRRAR